MKKLTALLGFFCLLISSYSKAQIPTPFYAGEYYSDQIDIIDTTDLTFTITGSMTATSDFGSVDGIYGMALHPTTEEMYVCYQSSGAGSRRLGTIDEATAAITDIGNCGNIIDICFDATGILYGSTGNFSADYSFVIIDLTTAAQIFIFDYTPSSYGGGMAYNSFTDEIYYQNNNGSSFVDPGTFIETVGSPVGSPGETQAMEILTPTLGWMNFYGTLYSFNPITEVFTNTGTSIDAYHAFSFGAPICDTLTLTASAVELCEGEELTLTATGPGSISWDSGVLDGTPFIPGVAGDYTYTATTDFATACVPDFTIDITVVALPAVDGTASSELICIGDSILFDASGADSYAWNVAGVLEGMYYTPTATGTVEHIVTGTDAATTCENSDTIDVEVVDLIDATATATDELLGSDGTVDLSYTGGAPAFTFDWDNDGTGDFDDTEDLTDLDPGTYTVIIMSEAGCSDTVSATVGTQLSISVNQLPSIHTYPNPTSDQLNIEMTGSFSYQLIAISGKTLLTGTGAKKETLDLSEVASGAYFLSIQQDDFSKTLKVIRK